MISKCAPSFMSPILVRDLPHDLKLVIAIALNLEERKVAALKGARDFRLFNLPETFDPEARAQHRHFASLGTAACWRQELHLHDHCRGSLVGSICGGDGFAWGMGGEPMSGVLQALHASSEAP